MKIALIWLFRLGFIKPRKLSSKRSHHLQYVGNCVSDV
jgi:hypothetical protein